MTAVVIFLTVCSGFLSAFDLEQETKWRQRENALKVQIAQLEATLKSDLGEKGSVIDRYAQEKGQLEQNFLSIYREMLVF